MRRCEKCRIDFTGDLDRCPLCQAELTGEASPSLFPENRVKRSNTLVLRVLAFVTGAGVLAMLFFGHVFELPSGIVLTVCLAVLVNYAFVRHIINTAPDFLRLVARYFLVLLGVAALWFALSGDLVVTTFVIPSICFAALLTDAVLVCVFRGTFVSGYAKYLLLDVVFGLVPVAFTAFGLTWNDLPAYLSGLLACLLLLALVVFMREQLVAEIRKLFTA